MVVPIGPAALAGQYAEHNVVGGWFGRLFRKFKHLLQHAAAIAIDIGAAGFGIPPGTAFMVSELLMKAHSGDPKARAKVRKLAAKDQNMRLYMKAVNRGIKKHPAFATYKAHRHPHAATAHA
jgi:hypothetical protein